MTPVRAHQPWTPAAQRSELDIKGDPRNRHHQQSRVASAESFRIPLQDQPRRPVRHWYHLPPATAYGNQLLEATGGVMADKSKSRAELPFIMTA